MKQQHIKNHFVPKFYLKNWVNESHKIDVYRTLVQHENVYLWKSYYPSEIACQDHLYTKTIDGKESDELESWFDKEFESPAKSIIKKVISEQKLSSEDWEILIRFVAVQDLRTPISLLDYLKNEKPIQEALLKKNLEDVANKMQSKEFRNQLLHEEKNKFNHNDLPLKISFYNSPDNKSLRINAKSYIGRKSWLFLVKGTLENSLNLLLDQKWTIIKPALGYSFLTSDNPVIKLNYHSNNNYSLAGTGSWVKPKSNIILPLSPSYAMLTEIGEKYPPQRGFKLSVQRTKEMKEFIAKK